MRTYRLGRRALSDLRAISEYIGKDNPAAALRWLERVHDFFALLTT
jgi:plasmid stabilization system protein ParE